MRLPGFVVLSFLLGAMPPEHALAAGEQAPTPTPPPTVGATTGSAPSGPDLLHQPLRADALTLPHSEG